MENNLEQQILEIVTADNYQPVKPKVITKKLGLPKERTPEVRKAVKRMAKQGRLEWGSKHLVKPLKAGKGGKNSNEVIGIFRPTQQGYSFVTPRRQPATPVTADKGDAGTDGTSPKATEKAMLDIFIPPQKGLDALNGDVVKVKLQKSKSREHARRGPEGVVIEVVERHTNRFVGVYSDERGYAEVAVDGHTFTEPIPVGDPGAKRVQEGDKVVIEMVRFPYRHDDGEAVIVEVLGPRGAPGVDTMSIICEFGLPQEFPEEALESAREQAAKFNEAIEDGRLDLTDDIVVTIDPKDARDFDDAISLNRVENGHWRLGVHIADVAHFVPLGSDLDIEARERATSVYLPDRVIPMLPEIISNNLASLQPDRVRYAKTVFIEFTAEGVPVGADVHNTAIKSKRRFTYEEIDSFLEHPSVWRAELSKEVFTLVDQMHKLAMILRKRRLDGGSIELALPEVKIDLDKDGKVSGAHLVEHTESHQVIEEFMLAANEAVAEILYADNWHYLRRVHELPSPQKLKTLTKFVRELGIDCESLESRYELKRVIADVSGRKESYAVHYAILRSMAKAHYSPKVEKHYALNSQHYCHFTSPIRRYPDLTVHRLIDDKVKGKKPENDFDKLTMLGEHCSEQEQRAAKAERELIKLKLLNYLNSRVGMKMEAVITGVKREGVYAQGIELPAEGFVPLVTLMDDTYDYDRATHSLTGRRAGNAYRLGDHVQVEVAHVDPDKRELHFRILRDGDDRAGDGRRDRNSGERGDRREGGRGRDSRGPQAPGGRTGLTYGKKKFRGKKTGGKRRPAKKRDSHNSASSGSAQSESNAPENATKKKKRKRPAYRDVDGQHISKKEQRRRRKR